MRALRNSFVITFGSIGLYLAAYATDASAKACTGPRSYYDKYPAPF
jgi:hypothetical protein